MAGVSYLRVEVLGVEEIYSLTAKRLDPAGSEPVGDGYTLGQSEIARPSIPTQA